MRGFPSCPSPHGLALAKMNCGSRFAQPPRCCRQPKVFRRSADRVENNTLPEALVDPHISTPENLDRRIVGSSADANKIDEPVSYLRRLKADVSGTSPAPATTATSTTTATGSATKDPAAASPGFVERRLTPRMRCSGSVELHADDAGARLWGTLTDISLHGCYVEMNTTFPVDTRVHLVLKSFGLRIETSGTVRATYPFLGMGILFADIKVEELRILEQLCSVLAGRNGISGAALAAKDNKDDLSSVDPKSLVGEIEEFFRRKPLLSREEFYAIAGRLRRP
jgi:PilZ domain